MASTAAAPAPQAASVQASWFPMLVIALAQVQMSFNISALPVSIGGIVEDFNTSPSTISTALVMYSLAVAALVMVGAKLGQRYGSRNLFQAGAIGHGIGMAMMVFAAGPTMMIVAQAVAGMGAALLVPALVVMIATHYEGRQKSQAIGYLQSSQALAGVLAFFIAGAMATLLGWRSSYVLICIIAVAVFALSFRLKSPAGKKSVTIDKVGALLIAAAVILISIGFDNLNRWGLFSANPNAPFSIAGMSPAPLMIVFGLVLGQAFFLWSYQRAEKDLPPLLALDTVNSAAKVATAFCLLIVGALGPAVTFLIPLYIQIVQGRTEFQTSIAIVPYSFAIFVAAFLSVRLFDRFTPRNIAIVAFSVLAAGLAFLAIVIQNEWSTIWVIAGLIVTGLGEGVLLTLMFNLMVRSSPTRYAGDVGALRGTVNNLSTAVGTAIAAALVIGVLSVNVMRDIEYYDSISPELIEAVNLDDIDFVSNDRLESILEEYNASPADVEAARSLNETARLS
ncbi:MAG: MFS transporter, partial [Anaerolineae bacterium]|nr:MFS transporter [Anaerolineae bacterium]